VRIRLQFSRPISLLGHMEALGYVLGGVEFLLVPVSLLGLLWNLARRSSQTRRWAIPLALGLALTVAQPVGIVAKRVSGPPAGGRVVGQTSVHVARIGGVVPVLPFALYRERIQGPISDQAPNAALKARSWLWLPILINATRIARICAGDVRVPCWGTTPNSNSGPSNALRVEEKDGRYYATLSIPLAARYVAPSSYTWELVPGIASIAGLIYWALLALLIPGVLITSRPIKLSAPSTGMPL
jgi:hypothetical protein